MDSLLKMVAVYPELSDVIFWILAVLGVFVTGWVVFWSYFDFRKPLKRMSCATEEEKKKAALVTATEEKILVIGAGVPNLCVVHRTGRFH